jgi:hypothetical protein
MCLNISEDMQKWIERITLINEEFVIHRGETPSQILIRIREMNSQFIPLFRGDDSIGRDDFE